MNKARDAYSSASQVLRERQQERAGGGPDVARSRKSVERICADGVAVTEVQNQALEK
jgi:hypothetical protein